MQAILGARVGERLDETRQESFENFRSVLKRKIAIAIDAENFV